MAVFGVECLKPTGYEDGLRTPLIPYLEEKQHAEKKSTTASHLCQQSCGMGKRIISAKNQPEIS